MDSPTRTYEQTGARHALTPDRACVGVDGFPPHALIDRLLWPLRDDHTILPYDHHEVALRYSHITLAYATRESGRVQTVQYSIRYSQLTTNDYKPINGFLALAVGTVCTHVVEMSPHRQRFVLNMTRFSSALTRILKNFSRSK
jgi:hypothetical protein